MDTVETPSGWTEERLPRHLPAPPGHLATVRDRAAAAFVDDLRQYVLDRTLSSVVDGGQVDEDAIAAAMSMEAEDLAGWNRWSERGRIFLETLREHEGVEHALAPYRDLVIGFVAWFTKWQAAMLRGALEELSDLSRSHRGKSHRPHLLGGEEEVALVPESWVSARAGTRWD